MGSGAHPSGVSISGPSWLSCPILPCATPLSPAPSSLSLFVKVGSFAGLCPQGMSNFGVPVNFPSWERRATQESKLCSQLPDHAPCPSTVSVLSPCGAAGRLPGGLPYKPRLRLGVNCHSRLWCPHLLKAQTQPGTIGSMALTCCLHCLFPHLLPTAHWEHLGGSLELFQRITRRPPPCGVAVPRGKDQRSETSRALDVWRKVTFARNSALSSLPCYKILTCMSEYQY